MGRLFFATSAALALTVALPLTQASAQGLVLAWGQSSDMIGWQTLAQLMAPSGDPAAHLVEFETWATDQDIYATTPPTWPVGQVLKRLQPALPTRGTHAMAITGNQCLHPTDPAVADFPRTGCVGEEVRRNWASFRYIVANRLYSTEGLAAAYKAHLKVDMPADATEIKADWVRVSDLIVWISRTDHITLDDAAVRRNYYVQRANDGTKVTDYALVAFHFSTKQIKNWVWADFEHKWNPGRCDTIGCHDSFGAAESDVAPQARANQNYGECAKTSRLESVLKNSGIDPVWQNYCLKGSEVTFLQPDGTPSLLGNSAIERMDAGIPIASSSCITCHGYASFDRNGKPALFAEVEANPPVGALDPAKIKGNLRNDFIWGIIRIPPS
jgi:hypothetical protein